MQHRKENSSDYHNIPEFIEFQTKKTVKINHPSNKVHHQQTTKLNVLTEPEIPRLKPKTKPKNAKEYKKSKPPVSQYCEINNLSNIPFNNLNTPFNNLRADKFSQVMKIKI